MKITHTLVKEGGICFGMIMPDPSQFVQGFINDPLNAYESAVQAAKDAAIEYEDQNWADSMARQARIKSGEIISMRLGKGVYPLPESLEAKEIFQEKIYAGLREENDPFNWKDIEQHTAEMHIEHDTAEVRVCLRIPQGTDNRKPTKIELEDIARVDREMNTEEAFDVPDVDDKTLGEMCHGMTAKTLGTISEEEPTEDNAGFISMVWMIEDLRRPGNRCIMNELIAKVKKEFDFTITKKNWVR